MIAIFEQSKYDPTLSELQILFQLNLFYSQKQICFVNFCGIFVIEGNANDEFEKKCRANAEKLKPGVQNNYLY